MANTSWSGLTPENDRIWDSLFEEYVPSCGKANTIGGEILRAMTRIIYRYYNDGDMAGVGYGNRTVNSSDRYLSYVVPNYRLLDGDFTEGDDDSYEEAMLNNHRTVFDYLQGDGRLLLEVKNTFDSRDSSEEDLMREREWEREYESEEDEEDW